MGYLDTKQKIIETLTGRVAGTQIQPSEHQEFALSLLEYIRSVELISGSTLVGVAQRTTVPVQPDTANTCYVGACSVGDSITFENFHGEDGEALTYTADANVGAIILLTWNKQYWEMTAVPSNVSVTASVINYVTTLRKTYTSVANMNADTNPIGDDGQPVLVGQLVSVYNSASSAENGIYSRTEDGWRIQGNTATQIVQSTGTGTNVAMSQGAVTNEISRIDDKIGKSSGEEINNYGPYDCKAGVIENIPVNIVSGNVIRLKLSGDATFDRIVVYKNKAGMTQLISHAALDTDYTINVDDDLTNIIIYGFGTCSGTISIKLTLGSSTGLCGDIVVLNEKLTTVEEAASKAGTDATNALEKIGVKSELIYNSTIPEEKAGVFYLAKTIEINIPANTDFSLSSVRKYNGRMIAYANTTSYPLEVQNNGTTEFIKDYDITKFLLYVKPDTGSFGDFTFKVETPSIEATGVFKDIADVRDVAEEDVEKSESALSQIGIKGYQKEEIYGPYDCVATKIKTIDVTDKIGGTIILRLTGDASFTRIVVYKNGTSSQLVTYAALNTDYTIEVTDDMTDVTLWGFGTCSGTILATITSDVPSTGLHKEIEEASGGGGEVKPVSPYEGKYGVVMGDSHSSNRLKWVPRICERMGMVYDADENSAIVGTAANSTGVGYEDCCDPMYAQATRAIEQYKAGKPVDFIFFENVHYGAPPADINSVIPFKKLYVAEIGTFTDDSSKESAWFTENFSTLIAGVDKKLGTLLKSTWPVVKYDITFAGTPVAGTTFTIIIDGTSYPTPVEEGDTLETLVARVGVWVFDENNWKTSVSGKVMTLTYIGSGTAPTLTITYDAGTSGVTISSKRSSNTQYVFRYFNSRDLSNWETSSYWVKQGGWSIAGIMGAVEILKENIPAAEIIVVVVPCYGLYKKTFNTDTGQDMAAFYKSSFYKTNRARAESIIAVANFYNLKCIDIEKTWGVSLHNWWEFNPEGDVHPNQKGYNRMADTICRELGM